MLMLPVRAREGRRRSASMSCAPLGDGHAESLDVGRADRAADRDPALRIERGKQTAGTEQHGVDLRGVDDHDEDPVAGCADRRRAVMDRGTGIGGAAGGGAVDIAYMDHVSPGEEVAGHAAAHVSCADDADTAARCDHLQENCPGTMFLPTHSSMSRQMSRISLSAGMRLALGNSIVITGTFLCTPP